MLFRSATQAEPVVNVEAKPESRVERRVSGAMTQAEPEVNVGAQPGSRVERYVYGATQADPVVKSRARAAPPKVRLGPLGLLARRLILGVAFLPCALGFGATAPSGLHLTPPGGMRKSEPLSEGQMPRYAQIGRAHV